MKLFVVLAIVAGGVFLLHKNGDLSFSFWSQSQNANGDSHVHCFFGCSNAAVQSAEAGGVHTASPVAGDAVLIAFAGQDKEAQQAAASVSRLFDGPRPAAVVRESVVGLATTIAHEESQAMQRVRSVDLQTPAGEGCRSAVLRLFARRQLLALTLVDDLQSGRSTQAAAGRFKTGLGATDTSYEKDLRACLAAMPSEDRTPVTLFMYSV